MAEIPPLKRIIELKGGAVILDQYVVSPEYTLWNLDGWGDLSLANLNARTYKGWAEVSGDIPQNYVGAEAVMYDTYNKKYYKLMFTSLTAEGVGGGFSYIRQQIIADNSFGNVVEFLHTDYGNEVDYIDNQVAITRNVNQGIYNPYVESKYNGNPNTTINYYLIVPETLNQTLPQSLDNQVIEECYISHQQDAFPKFYLPLITTLNGVFNPKIYITNSTQGKALVLPIDTIRGEKTPSTSINGSSQIAIAPGQTCYFHAVEPTMWACFLSQPKLI
jgi:hypothetical protein